MSLILGLDIGSSSCKSCLLHSRDCSSINNTSSPDYAIESESIVNYEILRIESDPEKWEIPIKVILEAIQRSIKGLDGQKLCMVEAVAVCGQMHGCVLWSQRQPWIYSRSDKTYLVKEDCVSHLYSWQDQRCSSQFIDSLPKCKSPLATGFGLATLSWLQKHQPDYLSKFDCTGTIMDFIVSLLCQLEKPLMSPHNAAGFGYYNHRKKSWSKKLISGNFPVNILPKIVNVGEIAGNLANDWLGLSKGTLVYVAFGDLQCSTFACIQDKANSAVLTISTSLQLVVNPKDQDSLMQSYYKPDQPDLKKVLLAPYIDDGLILAAASLNGGNVLEAFVNFIHNWSKDLVGSELPKDKVWYRLNRSSDINSVNDESIKFVATLFGERYDPLLRSSLLNISTDLTPNKLFSAICQGLIDNVFTMIPIEWLIGLPVREIKATGGALLRNVALKSALEKVCHRSGIKVDYMETVDAHVGAALMVSMYRNYNQSQ